MLRKHASGRACRRFTFSESEPSANAGSCPDPRRTLSLRTAKPELHAANRASVWECRHVPKVKRVRVICRDTNGSVLLIKWHDLVSGRRYWEPPGGGIKQGETPHQAAVRELFEETGLAVRVPSRFVTVKRDYTWLGQRYRHKEAFFSASAGDAEAVLAAPTPTELATFVEMRFVAPEEIESLAEPIEPPTLLDVLTTI